MTRRQPISDAYPGRKVPPRGSVGRAAIPRLSADEELELARRIEAGVLAADALARPVPPAGADEAGLTELVAIGNAARDRFVLANLGLVHQAVRELADSAADPDDLFQEGCLGLAEAIMRFDHTRGVRFSTHAYRWIRRRMVPLARRAGCAADEPASRLHFISVVIGTRRRLEETGSPSGPDAVARELGRSVRWVESHWTRSLRTYDDIGSSPDNPSLATPAAAPVERTDWWLDQLPPRERDLLVHRYGLRGAPALADVDLAGLLGVAPTSLGRIDRCAREHVRQLFVEGQCESFTLPGLPEPAGGPRQWSHETALATRAR